MIDFRQAVQSLIQELHEERRTQGEGHPDVQALRAYHQHALRREEADRLQEHLATCPHCVQHLLALVNFLEWDLDPHRLSVDDLARSWESFLAKKRAQEEVGTAGLCPTAPG